MTAWLSQKPRLTPRSQFPPEIVKAIHTMDDDLAGKAKPEATSSEPLVVFQPGQNGEAAFYANPEIRESENIASSAVSSVETSPFLSDASLPSLDRASSEETLSFSPDQAESAELPISTLPEDAPLQESTVSEESLGEKVNRYKKWIFLGIGIILLLLLLGGAWYWWQSREKVTPPTVSTGTVKETQPSVEIQGEEETKPAATHYSATQPNLLSFDTETITADGIATEFLKIALAIKEDNIRQPVEFLVRDQNYNPLAFSRFAYLLNLSFPENFLSTLDENFSLFFYLDQDRPRMGLKLTLKDKLAFTTALKTAETTLPRTIEPFFLDKTTAPKSGLVFRSSVYQDQPVRYVNIDGPMNLSVDYAVRETNWFIGTSQKTLRALLDAITQP